MYPLYWTSGKEGIFMCYSYEFKRKCVEMYRDGVYQETPDGIKTENFRKTVREWFRIEEACGPEALKHKSHGYAKIHILLRAEQRKHRRKAKRGADK
jgi:transposase